MDRMNRATVPWRFHPQQRDANSGDRRAVSLLGQTAPLASDVSRDILLSMEDRRRREQTPLPPIAVGELQLWRTSESLLTGNGLDMRLLPPVDMDFLRGGGQSQFRRGVMGEKETRELARLQGRESQLQRLGIIQQQPHHDMSCLDSLAGHSQNSVLRQQQAQQQLRSEDEVVAVAERRIEDLRRMIQDEERNLQRLLNSRDQQQQRLDAVIRDLERERDLTSRLVEEKLRRRELSLRNQEEQGGSLFASGTSIHSVLLQPSSDVGHHRLSDVDERRARDSTLLPTTHPLASRSFSREEAQEAFVPHRGGSPVQERLSNKMPDSRKVKAPSSPLFAASDNKSETTIAPRKGTSSSPTPPPKTTINPVRKLKPGEGLSLALPSDEGMVSTYQGLIRQSFEFFQSQPVDIYWNAQGRKNKVVPYQLGLQCRYCACRPLHWRGRGSVYFPGKLSGVYQSAQNMTATHLLNSCKEIPDKMKESIEKERVNQRITDRRRGGKKYWVDACIAMGIGEREDVPGLWFC